MISILVTKKGAGGGRGRGGGGGYYNLCGIRSKWWQCYEVQQQSVLNLRNLN